MHSALPPDLYPFPLWLPSSLSCRIALLPNTAMKNETGGTTSLWMATADVPTFPPLAADASTEVCIVGAGIAGMTVGYLLARAGKKVLILDDGLIGGGETGRTTAHLAFAQDDFFSQIERVHGEEGARIAAESHRAAVDRIEAIVKEESIDCDFQRVDGWWFVANGDAAAEKELVGELAAAHHAGIPEVELLTQVPGVPFTTTTALRFPRQAQFHVLKYLRGLAGAIVRDGGRICNHTRVEGVEKRPRRPQVTTTDKQTVTADALVFATNSPVNDWVTIHTKQAPYRTYVIGMRVPAGKIPRGLYWDNEDPYHYVRLQGTSNAKAEILIVGGEDHKTGQADDQEQRFSALERWTREHFPMATTVEYRWSGQVLEPVDYMGFIGRNPGDENIYIATGDSGQGMTHGTIAGILITDLIMGRVNSWATLYDPSRVSLRAAKDFVKENLNVAAQYRDYATPGEVRSPDDIRPGSGAVMRAGTHKVAVYKDETGALHQRSAICPHLYCVVDWNDTEKSWDCPCHGSRFDKFGTVLNGPAASDLAEPGAEAK